MRYCIYGTGLPDGPFLVLSLRQRKKGSGWNPSLARHGGRASTPISLVLCLALGGNEKDSGGGRANRATGIRVRAEATAWGVFF